MKKYLIVLIPIVIIITVLTTVYFFSPRKIPVITYHDFVYQNKENNMQISKKEFEEEMKYLHNHHYKTLKLKDIECFIKNKCKLPRKSVLITMDDGWKSELEIAAPILKKYNLNATIFYVGENYDGKNENFMDKADLELIKEKYPNIELASHSYQLHYEDAYKLGKEEIKKDIDSMKKILNSKYYAYPYGKYSKEYIKALKEKGYSLAFTFGPDKAHRKVNKKEDPYLIPRLNMSSGIPMWKFILRLNWYR